MPNLKNGSRSTIIANTTTHMPKLFSGVLFTATKNINPTTSEITIEIDFGNPINPFTKNAAPANNKSKMYNPIPAAFGVDELDVEPEPRDIEMFLLDLLLPLPLSSFVSAIINSFYSIKEEVYKKVFSILGLYY